MDLFRAEVAAVTAADGDGRRPSGRRAASQVRMGDFNQTVILEAIRHSDRGLSRVELAAHTGLSAQSISNIARQLIDSRLVVEGDRTPNGRGKPRTMLQLNPSGRYAVGIHLDPVVVTYVVLDLCGTTVAHEQRPTPPVTDPATVITEMASAVQDLVGSAGIERSAIAGVGIAAPGPVDIDRGVVVDPPNLDGWRSVPLRDALRRALALPVLLDKDVTAAAAGQKWAGGPAGRGDFVFFYLGTGVGAGLVVNGQVVRGTSYNVGEIGGFAADVGSPSDGDEVRRAIGESSQPRYLVGRGVATGVLPAEIDLEDRQAVEAAYARLAERAVSGEPAAVSIMVQHARRVVTVAADIANLLDLDHVVLGGPHWPLLRPFVDDEVSQLLADRFVVGRIHPLTVVGTSLGTDVGAIGAASLVLDHVFSTNPSSLLMSGP